MTHLLGWVPPLLWFSLKALGFDLVGTPDMSLQGGSRAQGEVKSIIRQVGLSQQADAIPKIPV